MMADIRAQMVRVREAANDIAGSASERFKDGTDKARESAGDLIETGKEAYADARDRTQRAATRANEIVQEHPVLAVAGAVAAGALIAWAFPRSRRALRALPGLATTAGAGLIEAALAARTVAADSAETVKSGASRALSAAKDGAVDAAATARDAASSADLPARASRLADEILALVTDKAEALAEAFKARLPKR